MPFFFSEILPRFLPFENAWVGAVSLAWPDIRVLENGRTRLRICCSPEKPVFLSLSPHSRVRGECLIRDAIYILPMQVQEE